MNIDVVLYVFNCGNGVMARLVEADGESGNFRIDLRGLSRKKSFCLDNAACFEGYEDSTGYFHEPFYGSVRGGAYSEAMYKFRDFAKDCIMAHEPIFGDDQGYYYDEEPWQVMRRSR